MPDRLRAAVVGCGVGKAHAEAFCELSDQFELAAVCDLSADLARATAEAQGAPRWTTDLAELCRMDDLDVINLCTPSFLHSEQTLQVLAAGKHVICEKPLAGSLRAVDEIAAAATAAGKQVMPVYQYRFGHGLQKLRRLVQAGLTGPAYLTTIETAWRRRAGYYNNPWRGKRATELGGVLVTHAIHAHDNLTYVLGPVQSVSAHITTRVQPIEVEDTAVAALEMADGSLATLAATIGSAAQISRYRFCFNALTAESNTRPYTNTGDPWEFTPDTPELAAQINDCLAGFVPELEGYAGQFARFHTALAAGAEPPVTLRDAHASLELITALFLSAHTGERVTLPIAREHPAYAGWDVAV